VPCQSWAQCAHCRAGAVDVVDEQHLPAPAERAHEFIAALSEQVDVDPVATDLSDRELTAMQGLIRTAFSANPDVAITATSLAGFALSVLYTMPYLSNDATGPGTLLAAVATRPTKSAADTTACSGRPARPSTASGARTWRGYRDSGPE
jgi:hypothetical protein